MKKSFLLAGLGIGIVALTAASIAYASSNNYAAWRASNGGGRGASVVTEQNFDQFSRMHQLMAEGKYEEAQKIRTDLGLGQGRRNGTGGCGMNGGQGRGGAGHGANFVDANNNGVCDHMENLAQ